MAMLQGTVSVPFRLNMNIAKHTDRYRGLSLLEKNNVFVVLSAGKKI